MRPITLIISRSSMSPQRPLQSLFTKNDVRYVVITLQDHEAWLANILTSWQFTA